MGLSVYKQANLVHWFRMEDTTDSTDSASLVANSDPALVAGVNGSAYQYDNNDYHTISSPTIISGTHSICAWYKRTNSTATDVANAFVRYDSSTSMPILEQNTTGSIRYFLTDNTSTSYASNEYKATAGTWFHAVMSITSSTKALWYVNGSLITSQTLTGRTWMNVTVSGTQRVGNSSTRTNGACSVDDVRVYSVPMSGADIGSLYNAGVGDWVTTSDAVAKNAIMMGCNV